MNGWIKGLLVVIALMAMVPIALAIAPVIFEQIDTIAADPELVCLPALEAVNDLSPLLWIGGILFAFGTFVFAAFKGGVRLAVIPGVIFAVVLTASYDVDRAEAQSTCLLRDGALAMTGNLNMGGNNITQLGTVTWTDGSSQSSASPTTATFVVCSNTAQNSTRCDYSADGTNDEVQIQAAIDALPVAGGLVSLTGGIFSFSAGVSWSTSNVALQGQGRATVLQQDADVQVLNVRGSASNEANESALASNVAAGTSTIPLAGGEGSNYSADDWILVLSDEEWTTGDGMIGEVQQISSISTDILTIYGRLRDAYATADSAAVKKLTPVENATVANMRFTNSSQGSRSKKFTAFEIVRGLRVHDIWADNLDKHAISLELVWQASINNVHSIDFTSNPPSQVGYTINVGGASQAITVNNVTAVRGRHLITSSAAANFGGLGMDHGIPRGVTVSNVIAYDMLSSAFDTHEESEHWRFMNCHASGGFIGAQIRGRDTSLTNCSFSYNTNQGILIASDAERITIQGGTILGEAEGIEVAAGVADYLIEGVRFESNTTDIDDNSGTGVIRNNLGYITENSGTAALAVVSSTVTHGLSVTPAAGDCWFIGQEDPTNDVGTLWIDGYTSTQMTLNLEVDPGASDFDIAWFCEVR